MPRRKRKLPLIPTPRASAPFDAVKRLTIACEPGSELGLDGIVDECRRWAEDRISDIAQLDQKGECQHRALLVLQIMRVENFIGHIEEIARHINATTRRQQVPDVSGREETSTLAILWVDVGMLLAVMDLDERGLGEKALRGEAYSTGPIKAGEAQAARAALDHKKYRADFATWRMAHPDEPKSTFIKEHKGKPHYGERQAYEILSAVH